MTNPPQPTRPPYLTFSPFPREGDRRFVADREEKVADLYRAIVPRCNAVRAGEREQTHSILVHGFKGVGKSTVLFETLQRIRNESLSTPLPVDLPQAVDHDRWFVLRLTGKAIGRAAGVPDAIHAAVLQSLAFLESDATTQSASILQLSGFFAKFRREPSTFSTVRTALTSLKTGIKEAQENLGNEFTISKAESGESRNETTTKLLADAEGKGALGQRGPAEASTKLAAGLSRTSARSTRESNTRSINAVGIVTAQTVVAPLNKFFDACHEAKLPTILIIDDFDEFATDWGSDYKNRSLTLAEVLGIFNQLTPTVRIVAMRSEYKHDDVGRAFSEQVYVPPMTRREGAELLRYWAMSVSQGWTQTHTSGLCAVGDALIHLVDDDEQAVVPLMFLQNISALWNKFGTILPSKNHVKRILSDANQAAVVRTIIAIATRLTDEQTLQCLRNEPLDSIELGLSSEERTDLLEPGLLRPANALDPDGNKIYLDPVFAYYNACPDEPKAPAPTP